MRKIVAVALVGVMLASPAAAVAQQGTVRPPQQTQQSDAQPSPPPPAREAVSPLPSPEALGISLDRVRRELRELPPVTTNLLRYDFHVDVYGTTPPVDFFKDFDLSPYGPVRYGGMTHAEFLNVVTPQAYRAPSGDLISLAVWAASQLARKKIADKSPDK